MSLSGVWHAGHDLDIPILNYGSFSIDLEGANNINVLLVLVWGFG